MTSASSPHRLPAPIPETDDAPPSPKRVRFIPAPIPETGEDDDAPPPPKRVRFIPAPIPETGEELTAREEHRRLMEQVGAFLVQMEQMTSTAKALRESLSS
jgi:hypothetical protein